MQTALKVQSAIMLGMNHNQLLIVSHLAAVGGEMEGSALRNLTGLNPNPFSRAIRALEISGFVTSNKPIEIRSQGGRSPVFKLNEARISKALKELSRLLTVKREQENGQTRGSSQGRTPTQ